MLTLNSQKSDCFCPPSHIKRLHHHAHLCISRFESWLYTYKNEGWGHPNNAYTWHSSSIFSVYTLLFSTELLKWSMTTETRLTFWYKLVTTSVSNSSLFSPCVEDHKMSFPPCVFCFNEEFPLIQFFFSVSCYKTKTVIHIFSQSTEYPN